MLPSWLPKTLPEAIQYYREIKSSACTEDTLKALERKLILGDLFYLLVYACRRKDMLHPWLFDRCREVQADPDGHLELWARDHYKSTIQSFGKVIQDILENPEITIGLFSHTKSLAKGFVNQIKRELENNEKLKKLFDDILWEDPQKQSPSWSLDNGLIVKRKTNPKEPTIYAAGLVDGMPTGMHFSLRVLDDIVTKESVSTPEQMQKTLDALDLADNLGSRDGRIRMIGTRYSLGDAYEIYEKRGIVKVRKYPATHDGTVDGDPVFLTQEEWKEKLQRQSPAIIASQMLQNPKASDSVIFMEDWFNLWPADKRLPKFDAVFHSLDSAFSKKESADFSCMLTFGIFRDDELTAGKTALMVIDCWCERKEYPDLRDLIIRTWPNKYGESEEMAYAVIIEDKASGLALIPDLSRAGINVIPYKSGLDKVARAHMASPLVRDGLLWLPESRKMKGRPMSWLNEAFQQWTYFPNVKHDDAIDALTQALLMFNKMGFITGGTAPRREPEYYEKPKRGSYSGDAVNKDMAW